MHDCIQGDWIHSIEIEFRELNSIRIPQQIGLRRLSNFSAVFLSISFLFSIWSLDGCSVSIR